MAKVADGIRYAERVVAGEIIACEYVRLACQRFLDDLQNGEARGIFFSEPRAQHILNFYKFIPHVKGAQAGQPIALMDWHVFILINIYGFVIPLVDEETHKVVLRNDGSGRPVMVRRFRTAYNEVARKNAKSTLSSGVGLYMTGADGEGGAEVYSAATTRDQARIVFEDAKNMVKKAKSTLGRLFEFNKLAIYQEQSASKFEPLSSDANNLDGLNIHCGIVDELHAHKTRDVWDVLETATGARLQSLLFGITTAGFNKEGICYELRDYAIKVLRGFNSEVEGAVKDDTFFAIIYTLDDGDDPFDETVWQKANPGLGICKRWDDLRRLAKKAKEQVCDTDIRFIRKHFNVVLERTVRELRGEPCLEIEEFAPAKQEIVCSRSFGERITDYEAMRQAICSYAARAAEKLRGEHQFCRYISVFVKTSPFSAKPYYGNHAGTKLLTPTQDTRDIIAAATRCLDAVWRDGQRYQKAGVMLGDFFSQGVAQLNLFDENAPRVNSEALMSLMDKLNRQGRGTLYFAGQGIQQAWQMKREMLSPCYTTRLADVPTARAW
ncbi:terminase large subunit domain-containing protein [Cronobacter malonaticus]|uniref:terminase large subunit domain-containing protein n=1 Tax=Cronobacter malonaticus TaxID=413503 RepID=UPI001375F593|nr:terminase large subunit [Cronobacter malonaticus]